MDYDFSDPAKLYIEPDGSPAIPLTPAACAARLSLLASSSDVTDILLNPAHPLHGGRTSERSMLQQRAALLVRKDK